MVLLTLLFSQEVELMERVKENETTSLQPLLLTIPQVMALLSLGRSKVYELIDKEDLPVVRFGRAIRVSRTALQQWLEQRQVERIA